MKIVYKILLITFLILMKTITSFSQIMKDVEIRVIDEDKNELIGVNAISEDQTFISITDINGLMVIPSTLAADMTIEFSYLGYKNIIIDVLKLRGGNGQIV